MGLVVAALPRLDVPTNGNTGGDKLRSRTRIGWQDHGGTPPAAITLPGTRMGASRASGPGMPLNEKHRHPPPDRGRAV